MTPAEFRQVRKDLKLTQAQLAEKLGVHPITISHYETGARSIPLAIAIAVQTFRARDNDHLPLCGCYTYRRIPRTP